MDGLTIIETLRGDQVRTGDDYPTKPFAVVELIARIEALLRHPVEMRETIAQVGPLELDLIKRTGRRGKRNIDLQPREFRLLEYMMCRSDRLVISSRPGRTGRDNLLEAQARRTAIRATRMSK
jgi:two-component system OmpR family response regulator